MSEGMELRAVQRMVGGQFHFQFAQEGVGLIMDKFAPRFQKIDAGLGHKQYCNPAIDGALAAVASHVLSSMVPCADAYGMNSIFKSMLGELSSVNQ